MNASILSLDSDEHRQVQAILPWFVNGTLEASEVELVRKHLEHCVRCQADAAWQAKLVGATADDTPDASATSSASASAGATASATASATTAADGGWALLRARLTPRQPERAGRWHGLLGGWSPMRRLQWAVAAQSLILAGLALVFFSPHKAPAEYVGLGSPLNTAPADAVVVFRPDATDADIRAALRASGARIVDGPTVTDAYLLRLAVRSPEALARLRAQRAVALAESLQAAGAPP